MTIYSTEQLQMICDAILISLEGYYNISDDQQLSIEADQKRDGSYNVILHYCVGYISFPEWHDEPPQAPEWVYDKSIVKLTNNTSLRKLINDITYHLDAIEQLPNPTENKIK